MKKVVIAKPGGFDALRVETHPDLEPKAGEVRVDVSHAGVNYADCIVRMGLYESAKKYVGYPITPGFEVAGTVGAVGAGVTEFSAGQAVYAVTRFFGYASQVCVPRHQVVPLPPQLSPAQAAGFPTVFLTAWYALSELAHPRPGSTLLVHSAAGGVGSALCQLGKAMDCTVVGVVGSSHKIEVARAVGADHVIDKSKEKLWRRAKALSPDGYDVVLDANGVSTLRGSFRALRPTGRLVIYGFHSMLPRSSGRPNWAKLAFDFVRTPRFDPLQLTNDNKSVLGFNLSYLFERADLLAIGMAALSDWLSRGKIRPLGTECLPFAQVAQAHQRLESAMTTGKLVLQI